MKVRDYTKFITEYKGRFTDACEEACPCRSCFVPHDCGFTNSQGRHIENMECVTRYNHGCPNTKPEPGHILNRLGYCIRCKVKVDKAKERVLPCPMV